MTEQFLPIPNIRLNSQQVTNAEIITQQNHLWQQIPTDEKQKKRNFNLKMGDIVYFKSYLNDEYKGVISGDGIASNKLECIQILGKNQQYKTQSNNSYQTKVGSLNFKKSLFQIMTGKKYQYQNQLQAFKKQQPLNQLDIEEYEKKALEENDENDRTFQHMKGTNLVYGQEIQLLHLYSDCTLTLNHTILAKQNCCRELSLEEDSKIYSNFRILSANQVKNLGDPILYGDQIEIQSFVLPQWNLGIQKPINKELQQDGFEVNASEKSQALKISSYIDYHEEQLRQQQIQGKYLQSGDVITIKNRFLGGYLTIIKKNKIDDNSKNKHKKRSKKIQKLFITEGLLKRQVFVRDQETNIYKPTDQYYFDVQNLRKDQTVNEIYEVVVDQSIDAEQNLNSLWEISHIDSLQYNKATYDSHFLIKHICTGLFLKIGIDQYQNYCIQLTFDGLQQECQFQLKSKKNGKDPISYSEACKIQSLNLDLEQQLLICFEDKVGVQKRTQKLNIEKSIFILKNTPIDLQKTSYRISSLQIYLIQFYIFLQNWALVEKDETQKKYYEYYEAFNNQKLLYDEIQQLFQSLENLKLYLTNDGKPQSNEMILSKQNALMNNGLINLLIAIQRLSNFMIYSGQSDGNKIVSDKSPQKIAKSKLDPIITQTNKMNCIQEIYTILNLCVQGNSTTSDFLLQMEMNEEQIVNFLLQQLKYQRKHVSELIKESVRYSDMSEAKSNISRWVEQLQPITEKNIEDQSLYIEILTLMLVDPYDNPNQACQNACKHKLFSEKNLQKGEQNIFQKSLIALNIIKEDDISYPIVLFNPQKELGTSNQKSHQFGQNNPIFCQLYSKYIEKQIKQQKFQKFRPSLIDVVVDFFTTATIKENGLVRFEDTKFIYPIFEKYENYLINILDLYSALCKGRNQSNIKCLLKNCFLSKDFLELCLERQKNINTELRFEKSLIDLYTNLYFDIDPLIKIQNFDNKCFLKEDLSQFNKDQPSGFYFYENNATKQLKTDLLFQHSIKNSQKADYQQLKVFAAQMLSRTNAKQVREQYYHMLTQSEIPNHFIIPDVVISQQSVFSLNKSTIQQKTNYSAFAEFQLQYFLGVLTIVRNSIDLGYNNLQENESIFSIMPNIFVALIIQQTKSENLYKFNSNSNFQQNFKTLEESLLGNEWVLTFFPSLNEYQRLMQKKMDASKKQFEQEEQEHEAKRITNEFEKTQFRQTWILPFILWSFSFTKNNLLKQRIYLEALSILKVIKALKINLQILEYLFSKQTNDNLSSPNSNEQKFFKDDNIIKEDQIQEQSHNIKRKSTGDKKATKIFQEPYGNQFSALLFYCLLTSERRTKLNDELLQVLIDNFHVPQFSVDEIQEVEIIDDENELRYFSIINGNSSTVQIMSPKEALQYTSKAIKFLESDQISKPQVQKKKKDSFQQIQNYLSKILEEFEKFFQPNQQESSYFNSFQNIVRNAGVHQVFLKFLISPDQIYINQESSNDIVNFYKRIILFFQYFTMKNESNIKCLLVDNNKYINYILDIVNIEQQEAANNFYIPIKIDKLILSILSYLPEENQDNFIKKLFSNIEKIGQRLTKSQPQFQFTDIDEEIDINIDFQQKIVRESYLDATDYNSLIQYFKILKALTKNFEKPAKQMLSNKHQILSSILSSSFLRQLLKPEKFYKHLFVTDIDFYPQKDQLYYHRIKSHSDLIILITECCKYYRIGIQEMQRILLYEQLKSILLHPQSEYISKRAYLKCLFELFINKVIENEMSNDTIENDEIRDILSRIIIPELDQKQIYKYLEGLAKLQKQNNQNKSIQSDLRNLIVKQKINYFEKRQTLDSNENIQEGIVLDISEYWKYLRKEGIFQFLVYTYDEVKEQTENETQDQSNLSDEFAIIKQSVQKIKEIFNVLERDFRVKKEELDLDEYRDLIISIEEIIPQRKITKFGQNFRIGFVKENNLDKLHFDHYNTLKEDQTGEKKLQEQDNVQRIENKFQRHFKIYLLRYNVTIAQFCDYIKKKIFNDENIISQVEERDKIILKTCNTYKKYISVDDLNEIKNENMKNIERQLKINDKLKITSDWEIFVLAMYSLFEKKQINLISLEQQMQQKNQQQNLKYQQEEFSKLKSSFKQALSSLIKKQYKQQFIKESQSDHDFLLSEDSQIELLMQNLQQQDNNLLEQKNLEQFLKKCLEIFIGKEIYLIKMCRILLTLKKPTEDEIDYLSEAKEETDAVIQIKQKKQNFSEIQKAISDSGLDMIAFDMLNNIDNEDQQIEAISFLIILLDYGNIDVQEKFYQILDSETIIKTNFFGFLRAFFQIDLDIKLKELEQSDGETKYSLLCLKILQLLQALCENVNIQFQKLLVYQYADDSYSANINVVSIVAGLLADLLEKGYNIDKKLQSIYRQALESLVEFSTGFEENRKELCKNTRLFALLNHMIQKNDFDFRIVYKQKKQNNKSNYQDQSKISNSQDCNEFIDDQLSEGAQQDQQKYAAFQTLESFIKLLQLLISGTPDQDLLQFILNIVDIPKLLLISKNIYDQRIRYKERNIILDNICDENQNGPHKECSNSYCALGWRSDEDNMLIQTGFSIYIICSKLADVFPYHDSLQLFQLNEKEDDEFEDLFNDPIAKKLTTQSTNKVAPLPDSKYQINEEDQPLIDDEDIYKSKQSGLKTMLHQVQSDNKFQLDRKQPFFKFYRRFTGRIEVQNEDQKLEKLFFQKPFLCEFLTPNIKHHIIYEINRETDEDRMQGLLEYSDFYTVQLIHSQQINNRVVMHFGAKYWRLLKDFSFLLCVVIVFLLVFMHDTVINSKYGSDFEAPEDQDVTAGETFVSYLNNVITIVQLVLNLIIVFFCAIERYPISITYKRGETNAKRVQILKKEAGFQISWFTMTYYTIVGFLESQFEEDQVKNSKIRQLILVIFFDFDNFYNICIFGLTVYAFFNPYIYAVLLLDLVKRSEDLQNIIKSITLNGRNLIIFAFLGLIGLLIYAIIIFSSFDQMFDDESGIYGDTFILAVTSTINFGLRNGGGLGDALQQYPNPNDDKSLYWGRWFFDFTFFIIFNILFIQIIFGIILDTFGELRDERQALVKKIDGMCFVCSLDKNDIETKGKSGWHHHIYLEHNVYHMLYYIIYLKKKDLNDCNALEKYVKKCIIEKETSFFPLNKALQMED